MTHFSNCILNGICLYYLGKKKNASNLIFVLSYLFIYIQIDLLYSFLNYDTCASQERCPGISFLLGHVSVQGTQVRSLLDHADSPNSR